MNHQVKWAMVFLVLVGAGFGYEVSPVWSQDANDKADSLQKQDNFIVAEQLGKLALYGAATDVQPAGQKSTDEGTDKKRFAIVIHGGAGGSPSLNQEYNKKRQAAMEKALSIGEEILAKGGSSLDAVEKVIRFLEDNPMFNSGRGAVFTAEGKFELDASIMVGDKLQCGAAASVTTVRHPITLARRVMEKSGHVFLVREGAEKFSRMQKLEQVENDYFWTDKTKRIWKRMKPRLQPTGDQSAIPFRQSNVLAKRDLSVFWSSHQGTVGCVALDQAGNICAGTSTGGMVGKRFGRVGDSPVIAAGTYADNRTCGISGTGWGEQYIRNAVAYQISARMRFGGQSLKDATADVMTKELNPNDGGVVGLDSRGNVIALYNTSAMAYAFRDGSGKRRVVWSVRPKKK